MNIIFLFAGCLEAVPYLFAMIQICVHQDRDDGGEAQSVRNCKGRGQEDWAVLVVFLQVECIVRCKDTANVVLGTRVIVAGGV